MRTLVHRTTDRGTQLLVHEPRGDPFGVGEVLHAVRPDNDDVCRGSLLARDQHRLDADIRVEHHDVRVEAVLEHTSQLDLVGGPGDDEKPFGLEQVVQRAGRVDFAQDDAHHGRL